ncbi:hypothetical protein BO78DRAFT_308323 [Aspergillus sclerotiicarbonarius CBS 121057]|uniref:Xylanolytic transcriptional activator regulatory domain-containing protein n=1 Tax=Aspergillus sclerotiicarbonarius (strain CBS 121057 / IBT 28362) TaxID=1448318 RepID=A0A319EXE7_ASPSB|nr:hypothetical protein BO78DRAFT_308323 [Aspergillus sclerotiicarbonarius CBS 121057]
MTPDSATPGTDAGGSNYHAIQARSVIELELGDCRHISKEQQSILNSALQLVSELAEKEPVESEGCLGGNGLIGDPSVTVPESPPPELLFMLLRVPSDASDIRWPDHISSKTFERMATALIKGDCRGHLFHQYCVCIYVKAISYVYQLSRVAANATVKSQLSQSRKVYIAATLRSIKEFDILTPPSLPAIQSLISGALLMQQLGEINQCWVLNSYAARQIAALGYQKVRNVSTRSDADQEIHSAVYWCYYIDKTLSALLFRSPSFPDMAISPTELIVMEASSPYGPLIRLLLDLSQIQGRLLSVQSQNTSHIHVLNDCRLLREKMEDILPRLQSSRDSAPDPIRHDWIAADFCYYAILVEIHRTRLRCSFTPLVHKECLACARRSLEAFRFLLQHPAEMPGFDDPYPTFFTWTLFLYPLTPFFVLFCHIIGSLDQRDFDLTQDITKSLSRFKGHAHLEKVLKLLTSLEQLCEPLFQAREEGASARPFERPLALSMPETNTGEALASAVDPMMEGFSAGDVHPRNSDMAHAALGPSVDWLTWQMFDSQLPSGWLNVDFGLYGLTG